jgi:hypothetical protein
MKGYIKPSIEFIELKPEERLACTSGGCCGCNQPDYNNSWYEAYKKYQEWLAYLASLNNNHHHRK